MASINGTAGNDTRTGTESADVISGLGGNDTLNGLGGDDRLDGGAGNDSLNGGAGNDTLRGGTGDDAMAGGTGNDLYYVAEAGDRTVEAAGAGTDTVFAWISHTLAANIENLTLQDGAALNGTGNGLANTLTGNLGANRLDGGAGADTLDGGGGNDTLSGGSEADRLGGGGGDDRLDGGDGTDRAVFRGARSSYEISTVNGALVVRDLQAAVDGNDGTDTLVGIERLVFKDMNLAVPDALDQTVTTAEDRAVTGRLTAAGPDGTAGFTYALAAGGGPDHGTVQVNADGTFTYTPTSNYFGADDFTFLVTAPSGVTDTATVSLTVTQVRDDPGFQGGAQVTVNSQTAGAQRVESANGVAALTGGGSVVVWTSRVDEGGSETETIMGQRFDAAGNRVGSNITIATDTNYFMNLRGASVTALNDGGFLATWLEGLAPDGVAHAQRYDAAGRTVGDLITIAPADLWAVTQIAGTALEGGGFVLTFTETEEDIGQMEAQVFDAAGRPVGSRINISSERHAEYDSDVTALAGGGFAVSWTSSDYDGEFIDVRARVYDSAGRALTSVIPVNSKTEGAQFSTDVMRLADGGFLVTWCDDGAEVQAQRFTAAGVKSGTEYRLRSLAETEGHYGVMRLQDDSLLITWRSDAPSAEGDTLYAQRYSVDGRALGEAMAVGSAGTPYGIAATAAPLAGGDVMFAWTRYGAGDADVVARHYDWTMV